jgi:hypothetical protein
VVELSKSFHSVLLMNCHRMSWQRHLLTRSAAGAAADAAAAADASPKSNSVQPDVVKCTNVALFYQRRSSSNARTALVL